MKKFIINSKVLKLLALVVFCIIIFNIVFILTHYFDYNTNVDDEVAKIALTKNNPQECSKIWSFPLFYELSDMNPPQYHIDLCYTQVAVKIADPEVCEYANDKSYCFHQVAKEKKDISICDRISEGDERHEMRGECYSLFTIKGTDKSICENLQDFGGKAACYLGAVTFTPNKTICDTKMDGGPFTDYNTMACYSLVAAHFKDASICNYIKPLLRSQCISSVAIKKQDPSLCKTITDSYYANYCHKAITEI
ncbi:MAG: hypothetical protein M3Q73_01810 [bacterium]|nr:hypothetical protein [bacterium]